MRMNGWSRLTATFAFTALGIALSAEGCGPNGERYFCDATGCYNCDGYGCTPVKPAAPKPCTGTAQCAASEVCTDKGCVTVCATDKDCPQGTVCKSSQCVAPTDNPATIKECTTKADCKGGYCNTTTNTCVACGDGKNGPCPCAPQGNDCAQGEVCSGGFCTSANICKYSSECGTGKVCADGQCLVDCSGGQACPGGFVCQQGLCRIDPNAPKTSCTGTGQGTCAQGYLCNQGLCVPDLSPTQDCGGGGTMCGPNQQCIGGYCKYTCSNDQECKLIDTRIGYCGKDNVCRTAAEAHPECTLSSECSGGKVCVANVCKSI
jgi:hypothetical protein